ncbi:hypothetical protein [Rhizobium chutanense]|nr:hypothetical protein [Rhizobium chutanense]
MIPDLTALYYFVIFGMICGVLAVLGGLGFAIWFVIAHVQIV